MAIISFIILPPIALLSIALFIQSIVTFPSFQKRMHYQKIAAEYQAGIDNVLWNKPEGTWLDYDTRNKRSRNSFYPSNLTPLYTESYTRYERREIALKSISYLKRNNISSFFGELNELTSVFACRRRNISLFLLFKAPEHNGRVLFFVLRAINCRLNLLIRIYSRRGERPYTGRFDRIFSPPCVLTHRRFIIPREPASLTFSHRDYREISSLVPPLPARSLFAF